KIILPVKLGLRNTRQKEIWHTSHIWTSQKKCKGVYIRLTGLKDSTESIKGLSI
ncbi:hypothetical protein HMPREF1860_00216, partial [Prevotella amnii]